PLHPSRQLKRVFVDEVLKPNLDQQLMGALTKRDAFEVAAKLRPEHDVLVRCLPRDQRRLLEYHHPVPGGAGDAPAVEQNPPPIRPLEACDQIDERRLTATGRADDNSELSGQDIEREILDALLPLPLLAVGFADVLDLDAGLRCGPARKAGNGDWLIDIIDLPGHERCLFGGSEQLAPGHGTAADHADDAA